MSQLSLDVVTKIKNDLYNPLLNCGEHLKERKYPIDDDISEEDKKQGRPDYQRDYTRILYSSAFRRLQGKMQLLGINNTNFNRNRLTHSLEVSQIAKSIADDIGYKEDIYVIDACCLGHDIGNPPFGHYGEKVINKIINDMRKKYNIKIENFDGNAQTLRILTKLETKESKHEGMNLTLRTLLGVTKYYNKYSSDLTLSNHNKFIYKDDYDILSKYVDDYHIPMRTIDAQIMDISDEIAYAAHDLEDTLKNKLFTIDEFLHEFKFSKWIRKNFTLQEHKLALDELNSIVNKTRERFSNIYSSQYNALFCKEIGSQIIYHLIKDLDVVIKKNGKKELGYKSLSALSNGLKHVTFDCVNKTNQVKLYEMQGNIIINGIYYFYMNEDNIKFLPSEYQERIYKNDISTKIRTIIDYIAGMMDSFAIEQYEKIYGTNHYNTFGLLPYERNYE